MSCPICLKPVKVNAIYCGDLCRNAMEVARRYLKLKVSNETRLCKECDTEVVDRRPTATYCSSRCKRKKYAGKYKYPKNVSHTS